MAFISICGFQVSDGNLDDPTFYFCGLPHAHGGDHGQWEE